MPPLQTATSPQPSEEAAAAATISAAAADLANSLGTTEGATVGDLLTATIEEMAQPANK